MIPGVDFRSVIEAALVDPPRGDEQFAHVSDLYGCDLATWARRANKPRIPVDMPTRWKWALGRHVETEVARGIMRAWEAEGGNAERGERFAWNPFTGTVRRGMFEPNHSIYHGKTYTAALDPQCSGCPHCVPGEQELLGHLDLNLEGGPFCAIGEVKSIWFGKALPDKPSPHYIKQAAGYATALGYRYFFIQIVACVATGPRIEMQLAPTFWFTLDRDAGTAFAAPNAPWLETLEQWATHRAKEVLQTGSPVPPQANPAEPWFCKLCGYAECPQNKNPRREQFL